MISKYSIIYKSTVKSVLSHHSKIDKTKYLKTDGSLMQVKNVLTCIKQ